MMRMLVHVTLPHEPFNSYVKDGSVGARIQKILGETKPEAVNFTEYGGQRGAIMIVNVENPSKIPGISEPWFLAFDWDVEFHVVMSPEDLGKSGLDTLGKKWA
jgi:hypothetical protein